MHHLLLLFLLILNFFGSRLYAQSFAWKEVFGGNEGDAITHLTCNKNEIIAAGIFKNQINFRNKTFASAGDFDIFIIKLDSNGILQRAFTYGNQGNNTISSLVSDSLGHIYFSGSFSGNMKLGNFSLSSPNNTQFIAKADSVGNILWAGAFQSLGVNNLNDLQISEDGKFLWFCGAYNDSLTYVNFSLFSVGINFFAGKISCSDGKMLWLRDAPYAKKAKAVSLVVLPSGDAWVCGTFVDSLQMPDRTYFHSFLHTEIFLARISADGNWISSKRFGGVYNDQPKKIRLSPDKKNMWMAGEYAAVLNIDTFRLMTARRNYNPFWVKMDLKGNAMAVGQSNTLANCYVNDLCIINDKVFVGGYFQDSLQGLPNTHFTRGGFDVFWYQLDNSNAVFIKSKTFGGNGNDQLNAFTNFYGNLVATGTFQNRMIDKKDTLVAKGFSDGWIVRLKDDKIAEPKLFKVPEIIEINVIQNKNSDNFTIISDKETEIHEWELFNTNGKKILNGKGNTIPGRLIDVGIYSLKVHLDNGMAVVKLQKK